MLMLLGALIGAGASIASGLLGRSSQRDANRANVAASQGSAAQSYRYTRNLQKDAQAFSSKWNVHHLKFAQAEARRNQQNVLRSQTRSIQDRVADAKAAGLHPLFALGGAASETGAPIAVGGQSPTGGSVGAVAPFIESEHQPFGEGVSRAVQNYQGRKLAMRQEARLERESNARVTLDMAQAALYASRAKVAEQEANYGPIRTTAVAPHVQHPGVPLPPSGVPQTYEPQKVRAPHDWVKHAKGLYSKGYSEEFMGEVAPLLNALSQYFMHIGEANRLRKHSKKFQPKPGSPAANYYWRNYK